MVLLLWWGSGMLDWLNMGTLERALHLLGWIIAGIVVYFGSLMIFGFRLHHVSLKENC
jgi:peptidoglycan biosynthesis protein MviN/MurJ (putative lipid II flippase)